MLGILNTQAGDRYLVFRQRHRHPVGRLDGRHPERNDAQAGLKQVIAERKQADLGTSGLGRLVI